MEFCNMIGIRDIAAYLTRDDIPTVPKGSLTQTTIADVLQIVFGFAGGIALFMVARSAFKYVVSQGEPQEIQKAKDGILYAVAGLVVSILAFSIVAFVIERVQ